MPLRTLLFITLALQTTYASSQSEVSFQAGKIEISHRGDKVLRESLTVLEQENCPHQKSGRTVTPLGGCSFLRGLFQYEISASPKNRTVFVEFTLSREKSGYGFIAAAPLEWVETDPLKN